MLLEARNIAIAYGDIQAVKSVGFHLEKGELVSIIGANGAGKTSILNAIMGIVPAKAGSIHFKENEITGLPAHKRAMSGIRIVPERARVFPRLSVYENLLTGVYGLRKTVPLARRLDWLYGLFPNLRMAAVLIVPTQIRLLPKVFPLCSVGFTATAPQKKFSV